MHDYVMQRTILNAAFDINYYCCLQGLPVDYEIDAFDDIVAAHLGKHGLEKKYHPIVMNMALGIFTLIKPNPGKATRILLDLNKRDVASPFYQVMLSSQQEEVEEIGKDIIEVEDEIEDAERRQKEVDDKIKDELARLYENKDLMENFFSNLGDFEPDDVFADLFDSAQKLDEMPPVDYEAVLRDLRRNHGFLAFGME